MIAVLSVKCPVNDGKGEKEGERENEGEGEEGDYDEEISSPHYAFILEIWNLAHVYHLKLYKEASEPII